MQVFESPLFSFERNDIVINISANHLMLMLIELLMSALLKAAVGERFNLLSLLCCLLQVKISLLLQCYRQNNKTKLGFQKPPSSVRAFRLYQLLLGF